MDIALTVPTFRSPFVRPDMKDVREGEHCMKALTDAGSYNVSNSIHTLGQFAYAREKKTEPAASLSRFGVMCSRR